MKTESKTCSKCKILKPVSDFHKSKAYGYTHYCKECDKAIRLIRQKPGYTPKRKVGESEIGLKVVLPDGRIRVKSIYKNTIISRYYVEAACSNCGNLVLRELQNLKKQKHTFCDSCKKHKAKFYYTLDKKVKTSGHILKYAPEHPKAKKGYVLEHRLIVEQNIGRLLDDKDIVHHIDCVKDNNTYNNLWLTNASGHTKAHNSLMICVRELMDLEVLHFDQVKGIYKVKNNEQE